MVSRRTSDLTVPETPRRGDRGEPEPADRPAGLPERYQLGPVIGAGGMGRVYRAHDEMLGRDVAIKVIESGPTGTGATQPRDRFVREARAAARLAHPNIVAVHDVDPDAGWLVMDLVEGEPLRDIAARGPLPPAQVRSIAKQILDALDAAHAAGVIHRDIKPSNIIVDASGKVTLVDFGVARLVDAELTKTGESLGTPAYMAPEQLRGGKVDARTDLYGLAATLYELVSGERMVAFESPSAEAIARVKAACGKERGLAEVIARCLQAAPEQRLGSAREALAILGRRGAGRGRRAALAVALLAVLGGGGVLAWRMMARPHDDPRKLELFALAQRGEHEKAALLLDQYVTAHPDDPDARTMMLLARWWETGQLGEPIANVDTLRPVQRDMLHGISLLANRHEDRAIAFLEDAARQHPDAIEIEYALGEARWHGQQVERGIDTLEHAFAHDPRWQMALHHVIEYRLSRGETAPLSAIADQLRTLDPPRGATLDCQIAIADRRPAAAATLAREALARLEPSPELYVCLMQAQILAGDLDGAEKTTKQALDRWPIDLREWGGRAIAAELLLYRGRLADFLEALPGTTNRQRIITLALWRPTDDIVEKDQQTSDGMRGQPIVPASQSLVAHVFGRDAVAVYGEAPEAELRAYGRGLALELHGERAGAAAEYRKALAAPAKGDTRMLIAYQLAHVLVAAGDRAGAKAACAEVIAPHLYQAYRAALLPDCVLWSDDPAAWRTLVDGWRGELAHPAVVEMRRRLAAPF